MWFYFYTFLDFHVFKFISQKKTNPFSRFCQGEIRSLQLGGTREACWTDWHTRPSALSCGTRRTSCKSVRIWSCQAMSVAHVWSTVRVTITMQADSSPHFKARKLRPKATLPGTGRAKSRTMVCWAPESVFFPLPLSCLLLRGPDFFCAEFTGSKIS